MCCDTKPILDKFCFCLPLRFGCLLAAALYTFFSAGVAIYTYWIDKASPSTSAAISGITCLFSLLLGYGLWRKLPSFIYVYICINSIFVVYEFIWALIIWFGKINYKDLSEKLDIPEERIITGYIAFASVLTVNSFLWIYLILAFSSYHAKLVLNRNEQG